MIRAERYERPLSLICLDLDRFKQCNDTLGHLEGDKILRILGSLLSRHTRQSDMAFRYGGDEFFVLLPESTLESAFVTAEKIRTAFNESWPYDIIIQESGMDPVTLSLGVAQLTRKEQAASFIKRSDLAMYEAKRNGGNRVVAASDTIHRHTSDTAGALS